MPKSKPKSDGQLVREFLSGQVRLSIWQNQSKKGLYKSFKLVRLYKDAEGKWQRTESFKSSDLLDIAAVCQLAHFEYGVSKELPTVKI